jgi:hypothetical protein
MTIRPTGCLLLGGLWLWVLPAACRQGGATNEPPREDQPRAAAPRAEELVDGPLEAFRQELLEIAFQSGSAIPVEADLNDRSRAQEATVAACLELDQPRRALEYTQQIRNWRRGSSYGDLAFYCARHGLADKAREYADLGEKIARGARDWRRGRIRANVARAHLWLGQSDKAAALQKGVGAEEASKLAKVRARRGDEASFDGQVKALEALLAGKHFRVVLNALESCAGLYDRFYADPARRAVAEEKIRAAYGRVPPYFRIEVLMLLAESALDHDDKPAALALVNDAWAMAGGARWHVADEIPLRARLAGLRGRAGEANRAREDVRATLELFDAERRKLLSHEWAKSVRAVAEACQDMGDAAMALRVYKQAVEEGAGNPNGRPRALDLSATCRSMALHGAEPDEELWARIREIHEGLSAPW